MLWFIFSRGPNWELIAVAWPYSLRHLEDVKKRWVYGMSTLPLRLQNKELDIDQHLKIRYMIDILIPNVSKHSFSPGTNGCVDVEKILENSI